MRIVKLPLLFALAACGAPAADIDGSWKAVFLDGDAPKTVSAVILDLKADGERLKGNAHVGAWPGDAPIIEGKVQGNRLSFTVYGNSPWWARSTSGEAASGLPKLTFVGTVKGNEIEFTMSWDSVTLYGKPAVAQDFVLKAARIAR